MMMIFALCAGTTCGRSSSITACIWCASVMQVQEQLRVAVPACQPVTLSEVDAPEELRACILLVLHARICAVHVLRWRLHPTLKAALNCAAAEDHCVTFRLCMERVFLVKNHL